MDLIKKHVDTVIILTALAGSILWMSGKFSDVENRFNQLEKDIAVIKAVMVMKNIMPSELCQNHKE
jgi:hypothetical protein